MPIYGTPPNTGQMDFVQTCDDAPLTSQVNALNRSTFFRVRVAKPITVTQMTVYMDTASGNIDLGIYQSDGTTLTRLSSTGSTAAAGSFTTQTINLTAAVTLKPGIDYYFGLATDNATVKMGRVTGLSNSIGAFKNRWVQIASVYPLPATQSIAALSGTSSPFWIAAA